MAAPFTPQPSPKMSAGHSRMFATLTPTVAYSGSLVSPSPRHTPCGKHSRLTVRRPLWWWFRRRCGGPPSRLDSAQRPTGRRSVTSSRRRLGMVHTCSSSEALEHAAEPA